MHSILDVSTASMCRSVDIIRQCFCQLLGIYPGWPARAPWSATGRHRETQSATERIRAPQGQRAPQSAVNRAERHSATQKATVPRAPQSTTERRRARRPRAPQNTTGRHRTPHSLTGCHRTPESMRGNMRRCSLHTAQGSKTTRSIAGMCQTPPEQRPRQ